MKPEVEKVHKLALIALWSKKKPVLDSQMCNLKHNVTSIDRYVYMYFVTNIVATIKITCHNQNMCSREHIWY